MVHLPLPKSGRVRLWSQGTTFGTASGSPRGGESGEFGFDLLGEVKDVVEI
jgi:hypothetical protein